MGEYAAPLFETDAIQGRAAPLYPTAHARVVRDFLNGREDAKDFLRMGMFSKELIRYLKDEGGVVMATRNGNVLPNCAADAVSEKLYGARHRIISGSGRGGGRNRTYPGQLVYHDGVSFGQFCGWPRIVHEALDSANPPSSAALLQNLVHAGELSVNKAGVSHNHKSLERLKTLGLAKVEGKRVRPTTLATKIFDDSTVSLWEKVKDSPYRIDVWT